MSSAVILIWDCSSILFELPHQQLVHPHCVLVVSWPHLHGRHGMHLLMQSIHYSTCNMTNNNNNNNNNNNAIYVISSDIDMKLLFYSLRITSVAAFTFALCSSSIFTTFTWPPRDACINAVHPFYMQYDK